MNYKVKKFAKLPRFPTFVLGSGGLESTMQENSTNTQQGKNILKFTI